jgi:chitinase
MGDIGSLQAVEKRLLLSLRGAFSAVMDLSQRHVKCFFNSLLELDLNFGFCHLRLLARFP